MLACCLMGPRWFQAGEGEGQKEAQVHTSSLSLICQGSKGTAGSPILVCVYILFARTVPTGYRTGRWPGVLNGTWVSHSWCGLQTLTTGSAVLRVQPWALTCTESSGQSAGFMWPAKSCPCGNMYHIVPWDDKSQKDTDIVCLISPGSGPGTLQLHGKHL